MGRITIICLSIVMLVLVAFGVNYCFFSEPKIITVYHDVDLRDDSVVVILENAPSSSKKIYSYWLKNRDLLKEKYGVTFSNKVRSIAFMSPYYEDLRDIENQYCFSEYIKNKSMQCISKDNLVLVTSYNRVNNNITLIFQNPFCITSVNLDGKALFKDNKCFK